MSAVVPRVLSAYLRAPGIQLGHSVDFLEEVKPILHGLHVLHGYRTTFTLCRRQWAKAAVTSDKDGRSSSTTKSMKGMKRKIKFDQTQ